MASPNADLLIRLASRYIWWKTTDDAIRTPDRIIAQVMDIGDYNDVQELVACVGLDRLRQVLFRAEAGLFSPKSWAYWHYRLGLAKVGQLPSLPERRVA